MKRTEWTVTGGFWVLLGILLLSLSGKVFCLFCLACLVHELGHAGAICLLGGRVAEVQLTGTGPVLRRTGRVTSYFEDSLVALAGPLTSFALALAAGFWGRHFTGGDAYLLAGLSLALAVFNLLPAGPLDGGRVLGAILSRRLGPDRGGTVCRRLTLALGGGLCGLGLWAFFRGGSLTLPLCAGWLLTYRFHHDPT